MYVILFVILLIGSIFYLKMSQMEGFTFTQEMHDVLPISISEDNKTISVPNTIQGITGEGEITFGGDLITKGNSHMKGTLLVDGSLTTGNQAISGNQTITGNQAITGNQDITGNQTITGDQVITKNQTISGNQTIGGTLSGKDAAGQAKALSIVNGLSVTGMTNLKNTNVVGDLSVTGKLTVNGDVNIENISDKGGKLTIGTGASSWTLESKPNNPNGTNPQGDNHWLEFYNNNTLQPDGHGVFYIQPDGNYWNKLSGWISDMKKNLDDANKFVTAANATNAAAASGGGGGNAFLAGAKNLF